MLQRRGGGTYSVRRGGVVRGWRPVTGKRGGGRHQVEVMEMHPSLPDTHVQ